MRCVNCGQPLQPEDTFCPQCGGVTGMQQAELQSDAPTPTFPVGSSWTPAPNGSRMPPLMVGIIVVVLVAAGGTIALVYHHHSAAEANAPITTMPTPSSTAVPAAPPESSLPTTVTSQQPSDSASAKAALDTELATDQAAAERLIGSWVPQLSSKRPGLIADGITYDYPQIWANFEQLRSAYPGVLLIWSGDYSTYASTDFYVTIVGEQYPDGRSANQWCDNTGLATTDCYAKYLSHTSGPAGASVLRG